MQWKMIVIVEGGVGNFLLEWLNRARSLNLSVNSDFITKETYEIAKRFYIDTFTRSELIDLKRGMAQ